MIYYEEVEGGIYEEEQIRELLFKEVADKIKDSVEYYFRDKYDNTKLDLDCDYQLLQLALNGKIEDVIEELSNVENVNFVNIDTMAYTDKICELKDAYKFFGYYYQWLCKHYGEFAYQGIEKKDIENTKEILDNLKNIDRITSSFTQD